MQTHACTLACVSLEHALQAFIGYKDHGDSNERILLHKFVDKQDISSVEQFVGKIRANGGADGPEDIAGALQVLHLISVQPCYACLC